MAGRPDLAHYAEIFRAASVGMFLYYLEDPTDDASLRVIDANNTAELYTGIPNINIVGKLVDDAFPGLRATGRVARFFEAIRTGETADFGEFEFAHLPGQAPDTFYCRAIPLADGRSIATCFERRTAVRQAERDAARAIAAAEAASLAKGVFLANMSHELRTPLNAIIGYAELLMDEAADRGCEVLLPDLRKIRSAGRQLSELVSDILDLSKIETGKMELILEPLDVPDFIADVVNTIAPLAGKRGNSLEARIDTGLPAVVTDWIKLRQILFNLLSNACKFTQGGRITLVVSPETIGEESWVCFEIADTGIGISPESLDKLFLRYSQVDASTTRSYGGTGLGLAITRQLGQMLGGDISVQSKVGQGSQFKLRIPGESIRA